MTAAETLLPVYAKEGHVCHILGNLLSNARKYSPARTSIDVVIEQDGDYAAVSVSGRGGVRLVFNCGLPTALE